MLAFVKRMVTPKRHAVALETIAASAKVAESAARLERAMAGDKFDAFVKSMREPRKRRKVATSA